MRKFVYICGILLVSASFLWAFSQTSSGGSITMGSGNVSETVTLSNGVSAGYNGTASSYGMGTVHQSGTKSYGTSSASTSIYYDSVNTGTTTPTEVSAGNSNWATDTWTLEGK